MDFYSWSTSSPATVVDLRDERERRGFIAHYSPADGPVPALVAVVEHALRLQAKTAVIEHRYIDVDWRSEHAAFYSATFRRYPTVAHRVHFFGDHIAVPADGGDADFDVDWPAHHYLGYTVLRPLLNAPVGRTVLAPAPEHQQALMCVVRDEVHLFGHDLHVLGAPIMSQDGQVGVCGHASAWAVAYFHHLNHGHPRVLPADISHAAAQLPGPRRVHPVDRVTAHQLRRSLYSIGLPPLIYELSELPDHQNPHDLIEHYVGSGLPIVLASDRHTRVVVGYEGDRKNRRYLAQDDEKGPYRWTPLPEASIDHRVQIIVPLPDKVFVTGEAAERIALLRIPQTVLDVSDAPADAVDLGSLFLTTKPYIKTLLMRSTEYKRRALGRYPRVMAIALRYHWMPRYIWVAQVVEAASNEVVAEALIDATDHVKDLRLLASWTPGQLLLWQPDEDLVEPIELDADLRLPLLERDFGAIQSEIVPS